MNSHLRKTSNDILTINIKQVIIMFNSVNVLSSEQNKKNASEFEFVNGNLI